MKLSPSLSFNGRCQEAMEFYRDCFDGKDLYLLTFENSPASDRVPVEWRGKIVHASLAIGECILHANDALPRQYQPPTGFQLTIGVQDAAEAERVFRALSEGGVVKMQLQKTFWSVRFGVVVDRFGITWEVNCQQAPE
jgi:PhnB protein